MNTVSAKFLSAAATVDQAAMRPLPQSHKVHDAFLIGVAVRASGHHFAQ